MPAGSRRSCGARLGAAPQEQQQFTLADGRKVAREIAVATMRLHGRLPPTVCILTDDGQPALLGAAALESFGLAADPVNRRLVEAELYLL